MGRYTDPKIILDKRFEAVSKGLETLYTNVSKNAAAIQARAQKKKALQAGIIKDYSTMYLKNTQESYNRALNWAESNQSKIQDQDFVKDLTDAYRGGLEDITNAIRDGMSRTDLDLLATQRTNQANKLTKGIVGFSEYADKNNQGLRKIGEQSTKIKGNKPGDVVIGSDAAKIFAATGTQVGEEIPINKLKIKGKLSEGVYLFFDDDDDDEVRKEDTTVQGSDGEDRVINSEIIDLYKMGEVYEDGVNPYYKEVEDVNELRKQYKEALKKIEKNNYFTTTVPYVDANGIQQIVEVVNEKKRQEYFLDESTAGGQLIKSIIQEKDQTMLAQMVGGIDFAYKGDFARNPVEEKILKVGLIDKLTPVMFSGSGKLAPSTFAGSTTKYVSVGGVDPDVDTIGEWLDPVDADILQFRQNSTTINNRPSIELLQDNYNGKAFKEGVGSLGAGKIQSIEYTNPYNPNGANNKITVIYNTSTKSGVVADFDTTIDEGPNSFDQFKQNLVHGVFPDVKPSKIANIISARTKGEEYLGDQETETRTSVRKNNQKILTAEEFEEMRRQADGALVFDELYDSWASGLNQ